MLDKIKERPSLSVLIQRAIEKQDYAIAAEAEAKLT